MKICAIIPARYQSSRFPGKPLALISGKPMIQHAYERALACPELSDVCIATDDSRITDCVNGFGGKAVMTSVNHRSGTDRIAEAAAELGLMDDDIVVNVQGDQPSFHPSVVTDLVRPLLEDASIPMSTLKCRIREGSDVHNPN
ncbi:MAG TPA: NTP transferase domain-containing protein, partial [Deltaproteobacteria bacterium]|nr:NTP transferase domain-containing protein [Deltaproteobacteria bacterium]